MFGQLTIILTLSFLLIVNARPSPFNARLPDESEIQNVEYPPEEDLYPDNFPVFDERSEKSRYYDGLNSLERINAERPPELIERLPVPEAQVRKGPAYKKSGTNYYMTLCHFKICNMGRKRDTRYVQASYRDKLRQTANQSPDALAAM